MRSSIIYVLLLLLLVVVVSVRFVKKKNTGGGVADRREGRGAAVTLTLGLESTPQELKSTETRRGGGQKNHWEGLTPQPRRQIGPWA